MQIIRAAQRHFEDFGWLKTYWLFSFDTYYDPSNVSWGKLRVFNDDMVMPQNGFGTHPHREMEIVTIMQKGEITHKDSMGHEIKLRAGEIQRMSAGSGITHSEHNLADEPLELFQIWLLPHTPRLKPEYEQKPYRSTLKPNVLVPLVSDEPNLGLLNMHSEATISMAEIEQGHSISVGQNERKHRFVYVIEGEIVIGGEKLKARDQARIDSGEAFDIMGTAPARLIYIETA